MTSFSREARLAAIAAQRERFSTAIAAADREAAGHAIIAELHLLLDDAWVKTIAASAFAPGVLGAMVRTERLAFEHLRECLDADPRWSDGVAALVGSLEDSQVAVLDASLAGPTDQRAQSALRAAMFFAGRRPPGRISPGEILAVGWSAAEVIVPRELLAEYAAEVYALRNSIAEPSLFDLCELATILTYADPSEDRDASLRALAARIEAILAERALEDQGPEVTVAFADLARVCVALGELARADALVRDLEALVDREDGEDGVELVFWAHRALLAACTAEERSWRERRLIERLPPEPTARLCRVALESLGHRSPALEAQVDAWLSRRLEVLDTTAPLDRALTFSQVALGAARFNPSTVDRFAESLARSVRGASGSESSARLVLEFVRENSEAARAFVERTARQRSVSWWDEPTAYPRLPRSTVDAILDGALHAHAPRWPVPTVDALRWVSKDLSSASARWVDALFGRAPVEQRAERALFAIGRAILRLGDRGQDAEATRVASRLASGEFAPSPVFDRVWWELGETAQRSAWIARPMRADRAGWLVPPRVIETLAGAGCAERYTAVLDQWVERTARACGAR